MGRQSARPCAGDNGRNVVSPTMTRDERIAMIERLRAENAESITELERQRADREADPIKMFEWLRATEPIGKSHVRKSDDDLGLVFRTQEDAALPAPEPDAAPSD